MIKIIDFICEDFEGSEFANLHQNIEICGYKCMQANRFLNPLLDWDSDKLTFEDTANIYKINLSKVISVFEKIETVRKRRLSDLSTIEKDILMILICCTLSEVVIYMPAFSLKTINQLKESFKKMEFETNKYLIFTTMITGDNP